MLEKNRIPLLDGYRFLAAIAVCGYHYWSNVTIHLRNSIEYGHIFNFPVLDQIFRYGSLGVDLFFLISGFVIALSAEGRNISDFVSSRLARILPTYWLAIALTTAFFLMEGMAYRQVTIRQIFANFLLLQAPLGEQYIDGVYWSIIIEIRFYVFVALLVLLNLYRHYAWIIFSWAILCLIEYQGIGISFLRPIFITSYGYYFAAGGAFYFLYRQKHLKISILTIAASLAIALPKTTEYFSDKYGSTAILPSALLILSCYALMAAISSRQASRINWAWLPYSGAVTYPLYLLHEDIGFVLMRHLTVTSNGLFLTLIIFLAVLLASWVIHRGFEKNACPVLRRWISFYISRCIPTANPLAPQKT